MLTLLHSAAKLVPRIHSGYVGCIGLLSCDFKDVAERVVVKTAHGGEICRERVTVSRLKLLDEEVYILLDELLLRLLLLGYSIEKPPECPSGAFFSFTLERSEGKNDPRRHAG